MSIERMTDADPRLALLTATILDTIGPAIDLGRDFMLEQYPDTDEEAGTHWLNGMLFGAVATFTLRAQEGATLANVRGVYIAVCEVFEAMVDRGSLDAYVNEILEREGFATDEDEEENGRGAPTVSEDEDENPVAAEAHAILRAGILADHLHDIGASIATDGDALVKIDRPDPDILPRLVRHVRSACEMLWAIESDVAGVEKPEWWEEVSELPLWCLPILLMACEHAMDAPNATPLRKGDPRWRWVASEASRQGEALVERYAAEEVAHV